MAQHAFSGTDLPSLGAATGLAILGFRSHAFGCTDRCCVQAAFSSAFGTQAGETLADLLVLTRLVSGAGTRKIALTAPGCCRMTRDEVAIACALAAAQAWDPGAVEGHLRSLLAAPVPKALIDITLQIADAFAGRGLAFETPAAARPVPGAVTPAFRLSNS